MKENFLIGLITNLLLISLTSCDGGGGKEEYSVYDVFTNIEIVSGFDSDCPDSANLKLSLQINGNQISGTAELFGFGYIGEPVEIQGTMEDDKITLEEFMVIVYGHSAEFGGSLAIDSLQFTFKEFQGLFNNISDNESGSKIEGNVSGRVWKNLLDAVICTADFSGEFTGEAKSPEGCLSRPELGLEENSACPAEAISRMCEYASQLCPIPVPSPAPIPTPPPGDFLIDNTCEASGCFTVTNCSYAPILTNLVIGVNGGISGSIFSSEGEHFSCF